MTTEADLIAAIVASPDEPAAFLVYADFLQSKNDPRGELITLMHAGEHKLADKLLRANKTAFLGRLAKLESSIKLEAWRLGFVDHVRIVADDERHAAQLIDEVADHPSTRFMRTLEVKIIGKRRSYATVDARLVELARPSTLSKIVLGEEPLSTALVETFSRVGAAPKKSWEDVVAAVSAAKRAGPGFAQSDLTTVTTTQGRGLPLTGEQLLRGLGAEVDGKQKLGLVARLHEDCAPDVLDRYGASLVTAWTLHGEESRHAWAYDAASFLGGARTAATIARRFAGVSHPRATHAIDCLARMRSPLATLELFVASRHWGARGEHAEAAVTAAAGRAKLDMLSFLARIGSDPRDAFDDDTAERFRELDRAVLELLMVSGWSAPLATVIDLFARAPRQAWARSLVWVATVGNMPIVFALDRDGAVDHEGRRIELRLELPVSLVHVADVDARELEPWRKLGSDPGFEQLERKAPSARSLGELAKLVDWNISIEELRTRGYRNGGLKNELHEEQRFVKSQRYRGATYTIAVQPGRYEQPLVCMPRVLPPVVAFELARDLAAARQPEQ